MAKRRKKNNCRWRRWALLGGLVLAIATLLSPVDNPLTQYIEDQGYSDVDANQLQWLIIFTGIIIGVLIIEFKTPLSVFKMLKGLFLPDNIKIHKLIKEYLAFIIGVYIVLDALLIHFLFVWGVFAYIGMGLIGISVISLLAKRIKNG